MKSSFSGRSGAGAPPRIPFSDKKKERSIEGPFSPTNMEADPDLIVKIFSKVNVDGLILDKTDQLLLVNLTSQLNKFISTLKNEDVSEEDMSFADANGEKVTELTRWADDVISLSSNALLDQRGFVRANLQFELGWKGGKSIYDEKKLQSILLGFVKVMMQRIILIANIDDTLFRPIVDNYLSRYVTRKLQETAVTPTLGLSSSDFINNIHAEFDSLCRRAIAGEKPRDTSERIQREMRLMAKLEKIKENEISLQLLFVFLVGEAQHSLGGKGDLNDIVRKNIELINIRVEQIEEKEDKKSSLPEVRIVKAGKKTDVDKSTLFNTGVEKKKVKEAEEKSESVVSAVVRAIVGKGPPKSSV